MRTLVLFLIPLAFAVAWPLAALLIRLGHKLGTFDSPGVPGQIKPAPRRVPNTGGIAIFVGIVLPLAVALAVMHPGITDFIQRAAWLPETWRTFAATNLAPHLAGIVSSAPQGWLLLASLAVLHVLGLIDDRRPLGPFLKLAIMAAPALAVPLVSTLAPGFAPTRLLTLLDAHVGGPWLSILLTALWFLVVTNALNFMDNMDGLSAGTACVAGAFFLVAALLHGQWFVGACLALIVGACLGFLMFNAPRAGGAKIIMGDSGSLVLGFLLAFLTVRTTYLAQDDGGVTAGPWYSVLMPVVVLAVPLYDFFTVVLIRMRQGKSPFVGDMQHLSHRLNRLGLSRRASVQVIWGLAAVTGVSGISLASLQPWQAALVGVQLVVVLGVVGAFDYAGAKASAKQDHAA
ncbi:MAG: MraY family glycosyltransferase [Phycisphaerales bacterium]